jgi:hypothetical protein
MFSIGNNPDPMVNGPQKALENKLIDQYLHSQGYCLADVKSLPEEEAKQIMIAACRYASNKLAEVESRARFRQKIHMK